ncbi:MAG: hypothetical protein HQ483_08595 [Rhodospirillales bacterium]|nr:hypothetical protein [Rhodospirillales bacterium]
MSTLQRPSNPADDFSIEHYREILRAIKKSHKTLSFKDAHELGQDILTIERFVLMRHDVEFSVSAALRLAEADHAENIKSTFFLLYTSDYNPFEEEEAIKIQAILNMGHDIGLHYDAGLFEKLGVDPAEVAKRQIALFESFFKTKIYAMSSHMPMRSGKTFSVGDIIDTYEPLYLKDIKYLSDSTQAWREGVVTENLDKYAQIHLLTHEYIWHPDNLDWDTLLLMDVQEKFQRMWDRALKNISTYREGLRLRKKKDLEFEKRFFNP